MQKYYSYPLLFFFIAAGTGLFLRWQMIEPTPNIRYMWFLHGHSHVMFLGWVLNVLYLSFIEYHFPEKDHRAFLKFFVLLQVLVVAMMISFPLQGYGAFSIIVSTLHTLAVMGFIVIFFRKTNAQATLSVWFAKIAWFFFFISTAGPFSLGYLMSNGMGSTIWYNFSIYYYLHFQYNGFFLFGIISLFYQLLEKRGIAYNIPRSRRFGISLAVACVPAYALSILYAAPGLAFNIIGAAAAILQLYAMALLIREVKSLRVAIRNKLRPAVYNILSVVLFFWFAKLLLQLLSAHPHIAQLAYTLRPVVIAYLHLVLLGTISGFLLSWYLERGLVRESGAKVSMVVLLTGFLGSQICLVILPKWGDITGGIISSAWAIFAFSSLLFIGSFLFCLAFYTRKHQSLP